MNALQLSPPTPQEGTNLETAFKVLDGTQEQIRFADAKAGFIVALMTVMYGFTASNMSDVKLVLAYEDAWWINILWKTPLVVYVLFSILSVLNAIRVVISRFGKGTPQTMVFFRHIVDAYGENYGRFSSDLMTVTMPEWIRQVGTQVLAVSHIANTKHALFRWSSIFAMIAVVAWAVLLVQTICLEKG